MEFRNISAKPITKRNVNFAEYPSVQLSNADEYKTPKEDNEDILECDYDSQETLSSRIIENTEIIEPDRVKAYPTMESPTLGEQNNEKATNGVVSESEGHTMIETNDVLKAEMLTLNFEEVELEEQIVLLEESQIIYEEYKVFCLLHGVFAFTGELTLQLPVSFTSSGFNKLVQLQDYKFKSRVQV